MASLLDVTLLSHFSEVFVFLFIFVLVYAVLKLTKVLGNDSGLIGLLSISAAFMFMFSDKAIAMVTFMVPWFTLLAVFIMLIVLNYRILGGEGEVISSLIGAKKHKMVVYWIVIIGIVIVLMALGKNYGQSVGPYLDEEGNTVYRNASSPIESVSGIGDGYRGTGSVDTGDFETNLGATLFHPKVLGMVLILIIASFTMMFMVKD
jgi:hypothetical protein